MAAQNLQKLQGEEKDMQANIAGFCEDLGILQETTGFSRNRLFMMNYYIKLFAK